jgi:hypothetical protein
MISLQELQSSFKQYLFEEDQAISNHVTGTQAVSGEKRLAIYAHAYHARLVEALETDYPALSTVIDEDAFVSLCHQYTHAYPSEYYSLRWFGQYFSVFMRKQKDFADAEYLVELAEFEWAFIMAFDAADAQLVTEDDIARIPQEAWLALKMVLHPSVQLISHNWSVLAMWRAARDDKPIPAPERLEEPAHYVIWRDQSSTTTQYRYLEPDEAVALDAASKGVSFVGICEALTSCVDDQNEIPLRVASLLKGWLAAGLIAEISW